MVLFLKVCVWTWGFPPPPRPSDIWRQFLKYRGTSNADREREADNVVGFGVFCFFFTMRVHLAVWRIDGSTWALENKDGLHLQMVESQSCIVSTARASINCGILGWNSPHICNSAQTDHRRFFGFFLSASLSAFALRLQFLFHSSVTAACLHGKATYQETICEYIKSLYSVWMPGWQVMFCRERKKKINQSKQQRDMVRHADKICWVRRK